MLVTARTVRATDRAPVLVNVEGLSPILLLQGGLDLPPPPLHPARQIGRGNVLLPKGKRRQGESDAHAAPTRPEGRPHSPGRC